MKRILCIDGGGMRGYLPASALVYLERLTGKRCHEMFDAIWGTSIGGILAGLLAAGMPASEAIQFFTADGPEIFRPNWRSLTLGLFCPRYRADVIEGVLRKRFAGLEVKTRLGITAFDLVTQAPYFFKFQPYLDYCTDLWQAARATSAAQTFFPAFDVHMADGPHVFWDGGNVANNPSVCATAEAWRTWGDERVVMLSLGCGQTAGRSATAVAAARKLAQAGAIGNGIETVSALFAAGSEDVDYQMRQFLGDDYVRIQPALSAPLALDDASAAGLNALWQAALRASPAVLAQLKAFIRQAAGGQGGNTGDEFQDSRVKAKG